MSEALAVIEKTDPVPSSVHLVARNPVEMQNAQADLAVWLKNKCTEAKIEMGELGRAIAEARTNGWSTSALTRQRNKAIGHFKFYEKLLVAVEAGYTIIPEFPITVFAIRVQRENPTHHYAEAKNTWRGAAANQIEDQRSDIPPVGVGEYVSQTAPLLGRTWKDGEDTKQNAFTSGHWGDVVFPLRAARPSVMNATAEAMALKVFDQIGICEPTSNAGVGRRRGDPLIIGQILGQANGWSRKCASFIIAWHLDLRTL